jgi:hypothetical protein
MIVSLKLSLPSEMIESYEKQGPLEKVISDRLQAAVDFTSKKPLYITDTQRARLDRLFGRNFSSSDDLVRAIEKALTVRIEEVPVHLNPVLLTRLRSRCFGKPFERFLEEQTVKGLEEYCGLR